MTLDGPSKTGKTCLGRHLEQELTPEVDGPVRFDSIGDFFRRMTVAIMDELGPAPEEGAMLAQLEKVIADDAAFDNDREWGDLHTDAVNDLVSTVGATPLGQTTKHTWAERASAVARQEQTGLWVVDGRNPSRTLAEELEKPDMYLVLDLFVHAEIEISARRSGSSVEQLTRRRAQDVGGPDPLLVYPAFPVPYEPVKPGAFPDWFMPESGIESDVISSSWNGDARPAPVYLDTSELGVNDPDLGLDQMLTAGTSLARVALRWYNDRNV